MTKKEKVKNFVKEHKKGIKTTAIVASTLGVVGACVHLASKGNSCCNWDTIVPWNTTDKTAFVKKCIDPGEFKDEVLIGLRNVTLDEIVEEGKKALAASGKNEDTVIAQVVLNTFKESK